MSTEDFFNKMEWEGGFYELLSYGLNTKLNNKHLNDLWNEAKTKFRQLEILRQEIEKYDKRIENEE